MTDSSSSVYASLGGLKVLPVQWRYNEGCMRNKLQFLKNKKVLLVSGFVLGALVILTIQFITYSAPHNEHYHANFAVYINGEREEFKAPGYYQEVAVCSSDGITLPEQRAHLHEQINDAVHIHDEAVTWGQFFNNIGWNIGSDFIINDKNTTFKAEGDKKLYVYINGQDYTDLTSLANRVINNADRLLVSYGEVDQATLEEQAKSVSSTAPKYNTTPDPASCSGGNEATLKDRFDSLF